MKGFTLIELTVVLALVAILAALALSSYKTQVARIHRAEVQQFMLSVANREETYRLDTRRYGTLEDLRMAVPDAIRPYYSVELVADNDSLTPGYTLKATPEATLPSESELQLDHQGQLSPPELWQGVHP